MNSKGQSFSVFQLLISAVVAAVILVILFQVLGAIDFLSGQNPNEVARSNIKSLINQPGNPVIVEATFKNGSSLVARTIAEDTGIGSEQICLSVSADAPNKERFDPSDTQKVIRYTGSVNQNVKLFLVCDRKSEMGTSLEELEAIDTYRFDYDDSCGGSDTATMCLVVIISS